MKRFIMLIKDKWLKQTSLTILLVALIFVVFIAVNLIFRRLDFKPIDFTKEKIYSLSDESKKDVKDIEQNVNMYFFNYTEDATAVVLGKQYHDINDKITVQVINPTERPDLVSEFGITTSEQLVAVSSNQRYKTISAYDMYSTDYTTNTTLDLTEQKLTNAIIDVTITSKPQIYFLTGHNEYGITNELSSLNQGIINEVMDVSTIDLLTKDMPELCDVLIIANPITDFADVEVEKIQNYINNGGKIVWMQDPYINVRNYTNDMFPNMKKILSQFGISFSKGFICENDSDHALAGSPAIIMPDLTYNSIVKDIFTDGKVIMPYSGRIVNADSETLESLGVTASPFIQSTSTSFYKDNLDNDTFFTKTDSDETGPFTIGETLTKKISDDKSSTLIAYSSVIFASDEGIPIDMQNYIIPIKSRNNRDLILNTVSYLTDREDSIRIRKDTGVVTFDTATKTQATIVKWTIFGFPVLIIIVGIVISIIRKRRK